MTTIACPPNAIRRTRRALIVLSAHAPQWRRCLTSSCRPATTAVPVTTAVKEASGSSTGTSANWRSSTPRPAKWSQLSAGGGTRHLHIRARPQGLHHCRNDQHRHHGRYQDLAIESIAISPLPHHIEPSHDGRTVYVSLASHTNTTGTPDYAASTPTTTRSGSPQPAAIRRRDRTVSTHRCGERRSTSRTIWATRSRASTPRREISISALRPF